MKELSKIRDLKDYTKVIDELLLSFVKTEEYISSSEKERCQVVDACTELKAALLGGI